PPLEGAMECARRGESEQVGDLADALSRLLEILPRKLAARLIHQRLERVSLLIEPSAQCACADRQLRRHVGQARYPAAHPLEYDVPDSQDLGRHVPELLDQLFSVVLEETDQQAIAAPNRQLQITRAQD